MALTSARDILNKKILGTGGVPSADEIPIDIEGLSASKLSVGLEEIVLDINQLSASVLTIGEKVENVTDVSSSERIVGKWIDGTDLYERTIYVGSLPNNDILTTNHNITNISKIVEIFGSGLRIGQVITFSLPYVVFFGENNIGYITISVDDTKIKITSNFDARNYEAYVTLRYTKTAAQESKKKTTKKK